MPKNQKSSTSVYDDEIVIPPSADFLKAKFQIGSAHGRINYRNEERVFHQSDVPQKAREAKKEVIAFLMPDVLRTNIYKPLWNNQTSAGPSKSYISRAPWDDNGWEDRHYKAIETKYLVNKAKEKVDLIRTGKDPRFVDPKALAGPWQTAALLDVHQRQLLESRCPHRERDPQGRNIAKQIAKGSGLLIPANRKLPAKRPTLVQRFQEQHEKERASKRVERDKIDAKMSLLVAKGKAEDKSFWNQFPEDHHEVAATRTLNKLDFAGAKAAVEQTYTKDALKDFIAKKEAERDHQKQLSRTQEHELKDAAKRDIDAVARVVKKQDLVKTRGRSIRRQQRQGMGGGTGGSIFRKTGTFLSDLPPPVRKQAALMESANAKVKHYYHSGAWQFSHSDECDAWSCCMSEIRDSRGCCYRTVVDKTRWNLDGPP